METYYISDLHFGHENIISLCDRPYKNVEEMNRDIIEKWNDVVGKNDLVKILGDVGLPRNKKDVSDIIELVKQLNGNKELIIGNHDKLLIKDEDFCKLFSKIGYYSEIKDNGRKVVLSHYPIEEWNGYFKGSYHIHGHVHNSDNGLKRMFKRFNVGVEVIGYIPRTLDELENSV